MRWVDQKVLGFQKPNHMIIKTITNIWLEVKCDDQQIIETCHKQIMMEPKRLTKNMQNYLHIIYTYQLEETNTKFTSPICNKNSLECWNPGWTTNKSIQQLQYEVLIIWIEMPVISVQIQQSCTEWYHTWYLNHISFHKHTSENY